MALTGKSLIVPLAAVIACAMPVLAGGKERAKFDPGPASNYETRLTISKVTIAAVPYIQRAQVEQAFGKLDPNHEGILPVLVIIQNDTNQAIALDQLKVGFVTVDHDRIDATPAADLKYLAGPEQPKVSSSPIPRLTGKKNPLAAWEIEGRAFSARMLAPKESANGFFYFRAPYRSGSTLYVTGLRDASSGKELFYFDIPLDKGN
jgi:hypothetical protein